MLYKTLISPVLTYASECWPLSKQDGYVLRIFERRILRVICGPVDEVGIWIERYINELYTL